MAIYFVSDFHCGAPWIADPEKQTRLFSGFADSIKPTAEYLYIIGDLFDFWFEYRDGFPDRHPVITAKLKELSGAGTKIVFIGGNHDWWAGRTFISLTGAEVAKSDIEATHYGQRLYLGHGDGIAHADWAYRILRRVLRNKINILLFSQLPYSWGLKLAQLVSSSSHAVGEGRQWQFLKDYENYASNMIDRGFDAILMGHTHIPQRKELSGGLYLNTGDWIRHFTYAKLDDNGLNLMSFANGREESFDPSKLRPPKKYA